jgi:hypothetical protein
MSKKDSEERLQKVELRLAYLTGAAVVGVAAILAFLGLTSWQMIPSTVKNEIRAKIGEETLHKVEDAAEKAKGVVSASTLQEEVQKMQAEVRKIREERLCDNPVEECICQRDVKGADRAKLVVCVSRCPDGRLRGIEIKEIAATTDAVSCGTLQPRISWR